MAYPSGCEGLLSTLSLTQIEDAALSLSKSSRAALASKLLESLDNASDEEIQKAWVDEAELGFAAIADIERDTIDAPEVFESLRARLAR